MDINVINAVSGVVMSPLVDKLSKKVSVAEIRNLHNSLQTMYEQEQMQEAFSLIHIIIKASGVRLPTEYKCIVDNPKLREMFIYEVIEDIEDILYDFE